MIDNVYLFYKIICCQNKNPIIIQLYFLAALNFTEVEVFLDTLKTDVFPSTLTTEMSVWHLLCNLQLCIWKRVSFTTIHWSFHPQNTCIYMKKSCSPLSITRNSVLTLSFCTKASFTPPLLPPLCSSHLNALDIWRSCQDLHGLLGRSQTQKAMEGCDAFSRGDDL